jgi:hypothetical protein
VANFRKAMDKILRDFGHDIYLQRRSADGKEWGTKLEKHTVRHIYPSVRGLPQIMQERPEGKPHTVDMD